ncbi:MAG TPA: hypothetical protein VFJ90_13520 [Candidatus Didemnitutus sp.]|nr:hypothetical protein [Candidatus Didemnitutus sp.]
MRHLLALSLLAVTVGHAAPNVQSTVPFGRAPLVDQNISLEEWRGAGKIELPGGAQLWVMQNNEYIFLCVKAPKPAVFGVDLFIADATGKIVDLQASAFLGERTAEAGKWPEWKWWNNVDWTATIVPYDLKDGRPDFRPTYGKEFQLSKHRFNGKNYLLRLAYQFGRDGAPLTFPVGAPEFDPVNWFPLNL